MRAMWPLREFWVLLRRQGLRSDRYTLFGRFHMIQMQDTREEHEVGRESEAMCRMIMTGE